LGNKETYLLTVKTMSATFSVLLSTEVCPPIIQTSCRFRVLFVCMLILNKTRRV